VPWWTNRPRATAWAVRNFSDAFGEGDAPGDFRHDGDPVMERHVGNARKQMLNIFDERHRQMYTIAKDFPRSPRKMDGAMADALSWEARGDAIAADAKRSMVPLVGFVPR
jgi:hypothetical protein